MPVEMPAVNARCFLTLQAGPVGPGSSSLGHATAGAQASQALLMDPGLRERPFILAYSPVGPPVAAGRLREFRSPTLEPIVPSRPSRCGQHRCAPSLWRHPNVTNSRLRGVPLLIKVGGDGQARATGHVVASGEQRGRGRAARLRNLKTIRSHYQPVAGSAAPKPTWPN